jgi:hypothetical protein
MMQFQAAYRNSSKNKSAQHGAIPSKCLVNWFIWFSKFGLNIHYQIWPQLIMNEKFNLKWDWTDKTYQFKKKKTQYRLAGKTVTNSNITSECNHNNRVLLFKSLLSSFLYCSNYFNFLLAHLTHPFTLSSDFQFDTVWLANIEINRCNSPPLSVKVTWPGAKPITHNLQNIKQALS